MSDLQHQPVEFNVEAMPTFDLGGLVDARQMKDLSGAYLKMGGSAGFFVPVASLATIEGNIARLAGKERLENLPDDIAVHLALLASRVLAQEAHDNGGMILSCGIIGEVDLPGVMSDVPVKTVLLVCHDGSPDRPSLVWGLLDHVTALLPGFGTDIL